MTILQRFRRDRRGQLQIAETVVSVTIIIVLTVLLIASTLQLASSEVDTTWLREEGQDAIRAADAAGLLRPALYAGSSYPVYIIELENYLDAFFRPTTEFTLTQTNASIENADATFVCGLSLTETATESVAVSYFVGSYSSRTLGVFTTSYTVQLVVWKRI